MVCCIMGFALGQNDSLNLQKYWKFRHNFVEQFIKIGPGKGESLPAAVRSPGTCVDNASQWGNIEYGSMHWGDGTIRHGHYLGMLATEYALRKRSGMSLEGILTELYYALNAINRLDSEAEKELEYIYFNHGFYGERLNGFFLREDIPEDFNLYWSDDPMHMGCVNSAYYENNNVARVNDPDRGFLVKEKTTYQNVPSLDQLSSTLVGLSVVHKLVDNTFVQPMSADRGFRIRDEVEAILDRILTFVSERNWQLIDVNGWPVGNGGGDLTFAACTFLSAAERMTGSVEKYNTRVIRRMQRSAIIQFCLTGYGLNDSEEAREAACDDIDFFDLFQKKASIGLETGVPTGTYNNQDQSVYQDWLRGGWLRAKVTSFKWIWTKLIGNRLPVVFDDLQEDGKIRSLPWPLNKIMFGEDAITHYNNTIMFNLGVSSGWWDSLQAHTWGNITENRQLELINSLITGQRPAGDLAFYRSYLDSMPGEGGYQLKGSNCCPATDEVIQFQSGGWASEYRWTHPAEARGDGGVEGLFSGLDYMYYHNLFYLLFEDSLPPYKEVYDCFCELRIQQRIDETQSNGFKDAQLNLNRKLAHIETCPDDVFFGVNHVVNRYFALMPKFPEYAGWGISTLRYQSEDAIVASGGRLEVQTQLVVLPGATLKVMNGGTVQVEKGTIHVSRDARIELTGNLVLEPDAKLVLGDGATLRIRDDASLTVRKGADVRIAESAFVQVSGRAEVNIEDSEMKRALPF